MLPCSFSPAAQHDAPTSPNPIWERMGEEKKEGGREGGRKEKREGKRRRRIGKKGKVEREGCELDTMN